MLNFTINFITNFYRKNLCIVAKFAVTQTPIARFQSSILGFLANALPILTLTYAIQIKKFYLSMHLISLLSILQNV